MFVVIPGEKKMSIKQISWIEESKNQVMTG